MKISFLTILLLASFYAHAQTTIRGNVTDSSGTELYPATLALIRLPDSVIIGRAVSGKDGFSMKVPQTGDYLLTISYIGFRDVILPVHILKTGTVFKTGTVKLAKSEGNLLEVVVKTFIPPVIVKRDTMVYNASAYKTRPNATVEDLLKKLPGIEVDDDGNITMQGKKVEKIYIDGKEFFLNDPKTATQNLTADMVQSIEAFDAASHKSKFTGIKDPNANKAINLKLKKDKKQGFFGKLYAGYGSEGSYSAGATANLFRGERWIFGNFNSNNINNLFTGSDHQGIFSAPGRQTNTRADIAYRDKWSKEWEGFINYSDNDNRSLQSQTSGRQTFFGDSSLIQNSRGNSTNTSGNHSLSGLISFTADSMNVFRYTPSFIVQQSGSNGQDSLNIATQKNTSAYTVNTGTTENTNNSKGYSLNNGLEWERKFRKKGRYLFSRFSEEHSVQDQKSALHNLVDFYDSSGAIIQQTNINQQATQHINNDGYSLSLSYTEPLSENHVFDFEYSLRAFKNNSNKKSFDLDSATGKYDLPDTLTTNHFGNTNTVHRGSVGYNVSGRNLNYQLGLAAQYSGLDNHNFNNNTSLVQRFVNWYPRASFYYNLPHGKNINLRYNGNSTSPTIDQLQPLPDLTNPFLVKVGNPALKQQFVHEVSLGYTSFDKDNFTSLLLSVNGDYDMDKIAPSSITLASGVQQLQYINVNGAYSVNTDISYGIALDHSKHGNAKFNTVVQYARDISFVNAVENTRLAFTAGENVDVNYNYMEKLFVEARAGINYTSSSYSIMQSVNTHLVTQHYSLDISYALPLRFNLSTNYALQETGSQGSLPGNRVEVWNATLYKNVLSKNKGEIRFSAFNLLDTKTGFSESAGANFIATQTTNALGRVFLLSFIYRFNKLSGGIPSH